MLLISLDGKVQSECGWAPRKLRLNNLAWLYVVLAKFMWLTNSWHSVATLMWSVTPGSILALNQMWRRSWPSCHEFALSKLYWQCAVRDHLGHDVTARLSAIIFLQQVYCNAIPTRLPFSTWSYFRKYLTRHYLWHPSVRIWYKNFPYRMAQNIDIFHIHPLM
jgi:hypothetical protein